MNDIFVLVLDDATRTSQFKDSSQVRRAASPRPPLTGQVTMLACLQAIHIVLSPARVKHVGAGTLRTVGQSTPRTVISLEDNSHRTILLIGRYYSSDEMPQSLPGQALLVQNKFRGNSHGAVFHDVPVHVSRHSHKECTICFFCHLSPARRRRYVSTRCGHDGEQNRATAAEAEKMTSWGAEKNRTKGRKIERANGVAGPTPAVPSFLRLSREGEGPMMFLRHQVSRLHDGALHRNNRRLPPCQPRIPNH